MPYNNFLFPAIICLIYSTSEHYWPSLPKLTNNQSNASYQKADFDIHKYIDTKQDPPLPLLSSQNLPQTKQWLVSITISPIKIIKTSKASTLIILLVISPLQNLIASCPHHQTITEPQKPSQVNHSITSTIPLIPQHHLHLKCKNRFGMCHRPYCLKVVH